MTRQLAEYFSSARIVRYLCRKRVGETLEKRRDAFVESVTGVEAPAEVSEFAGLLPARHYWPRAGKTRRNTPDPLGMRADLLSNYVLNELRHWHRHRWSTRLHSFICGIRLRLERWTTPAVEPFTPATILPIPKSVPGDGQKYRILAIYDLQSSVIAACMAAYARGVLEPRLSETCFAFRAGVDKSPPTHHDAVRAIRAYTAASHEGVLWAAECDIAGFFDAIDHDVARSSLADLTLDVRFRNFFEQFLAGYNFASARALARAALHRHGVQRPVFAAPDEELSRIGVRGGPLFGVPQGSAVSCVLANAVLRVADERCMECDDGRGFYARYCDDIVIIHPDRDVCAAMLCGYEASLRELMLPAHAPATYRGYGKEFWSGKSKAAYPWEDQGVPWLAFVGYHIRRCGTVRVRPASITKELRKQQQAVERILSAVGRAIHSGSHIIPRPMGAVMFRFRQHLLAFGTGVPVAWRPAHVVGALSWVGGFELVKEHPSDLTSLPRLDRGRSGAARRLAGRLHGLLARGHIRFRILARSRMTNPFVLKVVGWPLSYYARLSK
jgi:hypothetical protein